MIDSFIKELGIVFGSRITIEETSDHIIIKVMEKEFPFDKEVLGNYLFRSEQTKLKNEDILYDGKSYEVMIDQSGPIIRDMLELSDDKNDIRYRIGKPTLEFLLFTIHRLSADKSNPMRRYGHFQNTILRQLPDEKADFLEFLRASFRRLDTLKIECKEKKSIEEFKTLADAFTFEIAYNCGYSLTQVKNMDELSSPIRVGRRNRIDECEVPRRKYNTDLIYHYQMGLSTFHPALKFISFYHVLEHFYNIVYTEKMIEEVKVLITKPSFSPKRNRDIDSLIRQIKSKLKVESEANTAKNEIESLKLVLRKYLDVDNIINVLNEYDKEIVKYYSNTIVPFSQGVAVNFNDNKSVFGNLANRIYKTRNAVIHSKADEEERYIPFEHESQLLKEIPLLQFIAEEIIINTSEIL